MEQQANSKLLQQWLQVRPIMWTSIMASLFMLGGIATNLYLLQESVPSALVAMVSVLGGIALYALDAKAVSTLKNQVETTDYFTTIPAQANDSNTSGRKAA